MILPAIILGIGLSGSIMRLTRAQMLEVLRQDYIRTSRSKGLSERAVIYRHALRNAVVPIVTLLGLNMAVLISGTVVLESIFVLPGMGRYLLDSLNARDYPAVQAVVLLFATVIILFNLVVDLLYAWLDPGSVIPNRACSLTGTRSGDREIGAIARCDPSKRNL
jgi:peptide/nickel transport system permease protein